LIQLKTAMVLAGGLGTRMRPLTNDRPKALVEVAGRALIDRVLDRLVEAGIETAVVNVHHFADAMEAHLAHRTDIKVLISDERDSLLDSGGGIAKAMPLLGDDPFLVANIDSLWIEGATPALEALKGAWNPDLMDILVLLVPRGQGIGFEGPRGFFRDEAGRLTRTQDDANPAPLCNIGFQIMKPDVVPAYTGEAFSILPVWDRLAAEGRLFGAVMDGFWMHVGDPGARDEAEAKLS
jgi:MurNAc alpha-1-phosphate uridylyltransferase